MKEEWGTEMGGGCDGWPPPVFRGIIWFVVSLVDYQVFFENHRCSYDKCEMMSPTPKAAVCKSEKVFPPRNAVASLRLRAFRSLRDKSQLSTSNVFRGEQH